jgi:hypothetical protein
MKLKRAWWGPVRESPPAGESGDYGIINGFLMNCVGVLLCPFVLLFFWCFREKKPETDRYDTPPV